MNAPADGAGGRLKRDLGLYDVYAISTGAMFSSGFFLLPGLAAAQTGPSVALAYLVAGLFILPAMFSVAELATAMPRAGGAYYFLDRSLGPLVGTVGGLGTWVALVLKTAFALVGMGAYLALYFDVPIRVLAVALTIAFAVVNVVGARETSGLQRWLVGILLAIMVLFVGTGLFDVWGRGFVAVTGDRFTPFMPFGITGFMSTVGFVFVSYAGLTKVASVAEEIREPDKNIPRGMMLSLATATGVYAAGVYVMVAVLPPDALRADLTPVASAAAVLDPLPGGIGVALIVVAAIAAFASTGNAGVLSASRYPLAMARDRLVSPHLARIGRSGTPTPAILATTALIVAAIVLLPVEAIAKLASAFQLLLFSLLCLAVVIMRESRLEAYDPGYRSPFYPWMQIAGFVAPLWLIAEMGHLAIMFTLGTVAATVGWYFRYAADNVERSGAIFHAFHRLGERRHSGLDVELRRIVGEMGPRDGDGFREIIASAEVLEVEGDATWGTLVASASARLARVTGLPELPIRQGFDKALESGLMPLGRAVALPHLRIDRLSRPWLLLARSADGIVSGPSPAGGSVPDLRGVRATFFLLSPEGAPGRHLRLLGHLATRAEAPEFLSEWLAAIDAVELKATLFPDDRIVRVVVDWGLPTEQWIGQPLRSVGLPPHTLVALVQRDEGDVVPEGATKLRAGDWLWVIAEPGAVGRLAALTGQGEPTDEGADGVDGHLEASFDGSE